MYNNRSLRRNATKEVLGKSPVLKNAMVFRKGSEWFRGGVSELSCTHRGAGRKHGGWVE